MSFIEFRAAARSPGPTPASSWASSWRLRLLPGPSGRRARTAAHDPVPVRPGRGGLPAPGRLSARAAAVCALATLAACGGSDAVCTRADEPYLAARDLPELQVPPGMTEPERAEALAVPEARPGARQALSARARRGSCLDEPPSYFRSSGTMARSPEEVVASWAQAWANREADAVIALYSGSFAAPTDTAGAGTWLEQRREQVATGPVPDPVIEALNVEPDGPDRRIATFVQRFGANALRKELTLVRESGSWRIVAENVVEVQ